MTTLTTYDLDQFVADMNELLASQPDQGKLFDRGSAYLERLVGNPNCIPEQFQRFDAHAPIFYSDDVRTFLVIPGDVLTRKRDWPFRDRTGSKARPAVVVQADFLNGLLDDTVFVQITGTRHGVPGTTWDGTSRVRFSGRHGFSQILKEQTS